jgi:hypothetical protein
MSRRRSGTRRTSIGDLLDPRFYARELGYFEPSVRGASLSDLLDYLGEDDDERVEAVTALLRQSSDEERQQLLAIIQRALANVDPR